MNTKEAYNRWAQTYDTVNNKTRDLEEVAARKSLIQADFSKVIEIGCGTGKNTRWLAEEAKQLLAVDFSEEMMNIARQKVNAPHIQFKPADITKTWNFDKASLITCSLVLEHIQNIDFIFEQVTHHLQDGGCFYVCELHPYKQLQAGRARFEHEGKMIELEYFVHHISEFFQLAVKHRLQCIDLMEWFDDNDRTNMPRLLSFVFRKT
jgi:ubiquinone/menaquinone biosynthesis C-methylase UbiE